MNISIARTTRRIRRPAWSVASLSMSHAFASGAGGTTVQRPPGHPANVQNFSEKAHMAKWIYKSVAAKKWRIAKKDWGTFARLESSAIAFYSGTASWKWHKQVVPLKEGGTFVVKTSLCGDPWAGTVAQPVFPFCAATFWQVRCTTTKWRSWTASLEQVPQSGRLPKLACAWQIAHPDEQGGSSLGVTPLHTHPNSLYDIHLCRFVSAFFSSGKIER